MKFLMIIMTSVLVNNYVLSRFLGICPFLGTWFSSYTQN